MFEIKPDVSVWFMDGKKVKHGVITQVYQNIVDVVVGDENYLLRNIEVFPSPETLAIIMDETVGEIKKWEDKHNVKSR